MVNPTFIGNDHPNRGGRFARFDSLLAQLRRQTEPDIISFDCCITDQDCVCRRPLPPKCILSSRDVKSTGVKFLVVILPSTVMANVATTNGRTVFFIPQKTSNAEHRTPNIETVSTPARFQLTLAFRLGVESLLYSLGFANFMFKRRDFFLHCAV